MRDSKKGSVDCGREEGESLIPPAFGLRDFPSLLKTYEPGGTPVSKQLPKLQWACNTLVFHAPDFGHRIVVMRQRQGGNPERVGDVEWRGLGIPSEILKGGLALQYAATQEYLVYRYGVAEELDLHWAGDPEPF